MKKSVLLAFSASIALLGGGTALFPDSARAGNASAWPVRDFLPPVASINPKIDESPEKRTDNTVEPVALSAVTSPAIHTRPKVERLASDLTGIIKTSQADQILAMQQKVDEADMEFLWRATVEKNPIIRFSLEKLATPVDLQTKQSSRFLSRTLSMLIQGGTLATTMIPGPGGGAYRNMGTMAVGNALQNLADGKTKPTPGSLSNTEQIQLAHLVDELKLRIIQKYQDYKNTLQTLSQSHEATVQRNNEYSRALGSGNDMAVMTAGTAYYQALLAETDLRQKAKLYRLELERLAGPEAVSGLLLSASAPADLAGNLSSAATAASGGSASPASHTPTEDSLQTDSPKTPVSASGGAPIGPSQPAPAVEPPGVLPPAMEIGPSLTQDNTAPIGPPMPTITHRTDGHRTAVKKAIKSRKGRQGGKKAGALPTAPDRILELKETP